MENIRKEKHLKDLEARHESTVEMSQGDESRRMLNRITQSAKVSGLGVMQVANRRRGSIAMVGAGCAVGVFLMATERGKELTGIGQQFVTNIYGRLLNQTMKGWRELKKYLQPSTKRGDETEGQVSDELDLKVRQLQDKFRRFA